MRRWATILAILAVASEAFAYWGLNTVAGRHMFDEMAGMIPLAAACLGLLLVGMALLLWWRNHAAGR
jgi:hypothetical protein